MFCFFPSGVSVSFLRGSEVSSGFLGVDNHEDRRRKEMTALHCEESTFTTHQQ